MKICKNPPVSPFKKGGLRHFVEPPFGKGGIESRAPKILVINDEPEAQKIKKMLL